MSKKLLCGMIAGLVIFYSCNSKAVKSEHKSKSFFAMDTYMTINIYGEKTDAVLEQSEERVTELEKMWSVTDENSEIYSINHSNGKSIGVSLETAELLDFSLDISKMTDGALDCTMYPILTEWGFTTNNYKIPTDEK